MQQNASNFYTRAQILSGNNHSSQYFRFLAEKIQQIKRESPQSLNYVQHIADYNFVNSGFYEIKQQDGTTIFTPPRRQLRNMSQKVTVGGIDVMLSGRLNSLGAVSHEKTISSCSRTYMGVINAETGEKGACNLPCRKPSCPYCSRIVKKKTELLDRSQAIAERGKHHLRYVYIGGDTEFYGRMVLTLPKSIQDRVDRKDLNLPEKFGSIETYGSKFERDNIKIAKSVPKDSSDIGDAEDIIAERRSDFEKIVAWASELEELKEYRRELRKNKPDGYAGDLKILRKRIAWLKMNISAQKDVFEGDRITLGDIQRACYQFIDSEFSARGALITPHLTGDNSGKRGEIHIHFHALFPLFGDETGFEWSKNAPYIKDLPGIRKRWRNFLHAQFGGVKEESINLRYEYVTADGKDKEDIQALAFWVRYDHRIEAGGWIFPIMANDEDARRVIRMTTRQRYTRGYGVLSDRNIGKYQEKFGGKPLREMLRIMGDSEAQDIPGKWEVVTKRSLANDVPFFAQIESFATGKALTEDCKEIQVISGSYEAFEMPVKIDNLPKESEIVRVKYVSIVPDKSIIETAFETNYYHEKYNIWSRWKKTEKGYRFSGAYNKLSSKAIEKGIGFFTWRE